MGSALDLPGVAGPAAAAVPAVPSLDGDRRVGRRRRPRWGDRADARRRARRGLGLAGRVLHQPAVRRRRADRPAGGCCHATAERTPRALRPGRRAAGRHRRRRPRAGDRRRSATGGSAIRASLVCLAVAAVLLPSFFWRSSHHPAPLLDLDLFRLRSFTVGNIAQALFVGSSFGWLVLMPSFFHDVWGWSPLAAGFGLAPAATVGAILSPFAGRARRPHRPPRAGRRRAASAAPAGTLWWVARGRRGRRTTRRRSCPGCCSPGSASPAGFATLTGALMSRVPPRFYSMAGAARSTLFQLASAIGIAVAVALQDAGGDGPGGAVPQGVARRHGVRAGRRRS